MLIDREKELAELNLLLEEPGAHLLAVSGRRRLGKTTLLLEWARRSGQPYLYWVASRAPASFLLRQFSQAVWRQARKASWAALRTGPLWYSFRKRRKSTA